MKAQCEKCGQEKKFEAVISHSFETKLIVENGRVFRTDDTDHENELVDIKCFCGGEVDTDDEFSEACAEAGH